MQCLFRYVAFTEMHQKNPKARTNKRAARTEQWRRREQRLQRYICTLIRMTECTRSHNAQQDYSIVSNFALYFSEHCVSGYAGVCAAHMHVSQSA